MELGYSFIQILTSRGICAIQVRQFACLYRRLFVVTDVIKYLIWFVGCVKR